MSEFSEFLLNEIKENDEINKKSIRELAKGIGISHDYFGRIIHGKVIAPEKNIQEKIADKILKESQRQKFYDLAALDRKEIPIDIQRELSQKSKKWNEIRNLLEGKK